MQRVHNNGCGCQKVSHLCFPNGSERGLLFIAVRASHRGDVPCCGAYALGHVGSVVVAHGLSCFCQTCVALGFVTSGGEDFHLRSETRLDYLELFVQQSFIKV